jgi:predicted metal-binding membrane protein
MEKATLGVAVRFRRVPAVIIAAIAAAWVLTIGAQVTNTAILLNHGSLIEGLAPLYHPPPLWLALLLFVVAWQIMVVAMMLPSSLPMIGWFRGASATSAHPHLSMAAFFGGYLTVWGAFGALAFAQDIGIHRLVDTMPWLAQHSYVIGGSALLLAGVFQFSVLKERSLSECRHPGANLKRFARGGGPREAFSVGRGHGLACLGCCWALMLVMFGAGVANLWWMPALAVLMFSEMVVPAGDRLVPVAGAALVALGLLVLAHPGWLPAALSAG